MDLSVTPSNGADVAQPTAQSLQPAASLNDGPSAASASTVQPQASVDSLLTTQSIVPLGGTSTAATTVVAQPVSHHIYPVLIGFSGMLVVIAIVSIWLTARSTKNV